MSELKRSGLGDDDYDIQGAFFLSYTGISLKECFNNKITDR